MVELVLAKDGIGVRFPLAAPIIKPELVSGFIIGMINRESNLGEIRSSISSETRNCR